MSAVRRSTRLRHSVTNDIIDSNDLDNIENISWNKMYKSNKRKTITTRSRKNSEKSESDSTKNERIADIGVSPPKQKKHEPPANLFSPSRLLNRLSIDDSSSSEKEDENPPEEPATSSVGTPKRRTKYQNARKILNTTETNVLPGREVELEKLRNFLDDHLDNVKSGSLYVSGPPGTGKTACLSSLLNSEEYRNKFVRVYVNCTSISSIGSIYKKLCTELKLKVQGKSEKDHLNAIDAYLSKDHKMVLMVLDEIDQLVGQKQAVLYTIFEWPAKRNSKLLLIGIANSLDLTDRMLVRLNAKCEMKPTLMHFAPYSKQQIVEILKSRLEQAGVLDVFPPTTLQLLAGKVASVSGDIRRALDIGRRVVEITEQQHNKKDIDFKELGLGPLDEEEKETNEVKDVVEPVQIKQVITVLNNVYGASQTLDDDIESSFPLQQKILICTLLMMMKKDRNKDITIGRLHDVYKRICSKRNILGVDQAEFVGLCSLVETRGIVRIVKNKVPRLRKITLQWDEEEVRSVLKDKQMIAEILEDVSCLGR